jgi:urease accessory protein
MLSLHVHSITRRCAIPAWLCAAPCVAFAHTTSDGGIHHGFLAGALHPLGGLDHLAAMLAVGLWSALVVRHAGPGLLWAPLGFATMLLGGALLGLRGISVAWVEPMIAASLLAFGLLVATRLAVSGAIAALMVGIFAVFHGLAHGYELAGDTLAWPTLIGMLSTTLALHATGLGIGWALRSTSAWLPRAIGITVALLGIVLLGQLA